MRFVSAQIESKKILDKTPGLKQRTVQKRVSAAYKVRLALSSSRSPARRAPS